jgi:glycosyltransferase involved in cell wall biosynthesis
MPPTKINFALAIPTYNRVSRLERALASIESQVTEENVVLHCVVCNTASTDGTDEFLRSRERSRVKYVIHSEPGNNIRINWYTLAIKIPEHIDWVWLLGDDDFLFHPNAVQEVCDLIQAQNDPRLTIIHACQARRSTGSGKVLKESLYQLCCTLGYHEMLGWMSSLVVRRDRFVPALLEAQKPTLSFQDNDSALKSGFSVYPHSAALLKHCFKDQAAFLDSPLAEPQEQEQSQESIDRWAVDHHGPRYLFVVDDLLRLKELGVLGDGVPATFFRYLSGHLWDRYIQMLVAEVANKGQRNDNTKAIEDRLRAILSLLRLPTERKSWLQTIEGLGSQVTALVNSLQAFNQSREVLIRQAKIASEPCYPFSVLPESSHD